MMKRQRLFIRRDRGCVDVMWGRLRCPGRSNVSPLGGFLLRADRMPLPWVRSSNRTAQAPPPFPTQPMSLRFMDGAGVVLLEESYQFSSPNNP